LSTLPRRVFTFFELPTAIAVPGILLGAGIPSFREFHRNGAMASAANGMISAVLLARAEAVKRQVPVTFCLSASFDADPPKCDASEVANSTEMGFIVWVDESGPA